MTKSRDRKPAVAVLLSGREKFSPYYGGALARWTYEVYSRLSQDLNVRVFSFPTAAADRYPLHYETSYAWRACVLAAKVPVLRRYEDWVWLRSLLPKLRDFDVVHIHNRPQWATLIRRLGYQGKVMVHLQNDHLGHWSPPMLDALAPDLDALAVCSAYLRNTFAPRSRLLAAKSAVVFNGVNTDLFQPKEELREPKTIFFVGRLHEEKGVLQLVRAYAQLLKHHPDAKLVIAGSTGFGTHRETAYVREVQDLARRIEREYRARIEFPGYIHHDRELPAWFQRATVFACPSLFEEPFGLVNAEAMACATVVVGSKRGGIPEVVAETGYLVDPENLQEFAGALKTVLGDAEKRRHKGDAARKRVLQCFDWNVIATRWHELLDNLLGTAAENPST